MKKKNLLSFIAIISLLLVLGACGNKDKVTNTPTDTTTNEPEDTTKQTETETNNDATTGTNEPNKALADDAFGFTSFDLDIDLVDLNDAIEVDYDVEPNETEAEYENKIEKFDLHGDEAMAKLEPIFKELSLTFDMPDDEVIKLVSEAFGITDYQSFELEIKFKDQAEKEYKVTK